MPNAGKEFNIVWYEIRSKRVRIRSYPSHTYYGPERETPHISRVEIDRDSHLFPESVIYGEARKSFRVLHKCIGAIKSTIQLIE